MNKAVGTNQRSTFLLKTCQQLLASQNTDWVFFQKCEPVSNDLQHEELLIQPCLNTLVRCWLAFFKYILQLVKGCAEVFGTELAKNRVYSIYSQAKIAIFSWYGDCKITVSSLVVHQYQVISFEG